MSQVGQVDSILKKTIYIYRSKNQIPTEIYWQKLKRYIVTSK